MAAGGLLYYKKLQKERTQSRVPAEAQGSGARQQQQSRSMPTATSGGKLDAGSYYGKPKEDSCNICFFPFDDSKHHPISFIPCKHVCCAECSSGIVAVCHVCRGPIESRALLFSS